MNKKLMAIRDLFEDQKSKALFKKEWTFQKILNFALKCPWGLRGLLYRGACQLFFKEMIKQNLENYVSPVKLTPSMIGFEYIVFCLEQYVYKNIVDILDNEVVIDCGGCYGDTAIWAVMKANNVKVYSFEPNIENQTSFRKNLLDNNIRPDAVEIVPFGVASEEKDVRFTFAGGCSKISDAGENVISLTTIDLYCERNNIVPTFIKMDIEGAELDALKGASKVIAQYKPKLAICVYHNPMIDMIEIPKYLKSLNPKYHFYLKKSHIVYETVLFAIDKT